MTSSRSATLVLGLVLLAASPFANAQWQWRDAQGRMQLSDKPPGPEVPERDIVRRPPGVRAPAPSVQVNDPNQAKAPPAGGTASPRPATSATAPASGTDKELERRKKAEEDAKAAQKAEQDAANARRRAENCQRAQTQLGALQSGQRMATINARGEREFMDDTQRQAEAARIQEVIATDCR